MHRTLFQPQAAQCTVCMRVWENMKSPACLLLDPVSLQWRQISTQNPDWASLAGDPFDMRTGLIPLVLTAAMSLSSQPGALSLTFDSMLALCLKGLVLNGLILDCCCCCSKRTCSVSHRSFKVLNSTNYVTLSYLLAQAAPSVER